MSSVLLGLAPGQTGLEQRRRAEFLPRPSINTSASPSCARLSSLAGGAKADSVGDPLDLGVLPAPGGGVARVCSPSNPAPVAFPGVRGRRVRSGRTHRSLGVDGLDDVRGFPTLGPEAVRVCSTLFFTPRPGAPRRSEAAAATPLRPAPATRPPTHLRTTTHVPTNHWSETFDLTVEARAPQPSGRTAAAHHQSKGATA